MFRKMLVLAVAIAAMAFASSAQSATNASVKTARFAPKRIVMLPHIKERGNRIARPVSEH